MRADRNQNWRLVKRLLHAAEAVFLRGKRHQQLGQARHAQPSYLPSDPAACKHA
jgi:hypothetical protein